MTRPRATTSTSSRLSSAVASTASRLPLAAQLADRDELDERRIAAQLEDQRTGGRRRPVVRLGGPVGRSLELLAAGQRATCAVRGLHRDDRAAAGLPQPRRVARPGQRAVRRVQVAVLVLGGPGRGHGTERPERLGGEEPFAGRQVEQRGT